MQISRRPSSSDHSEAVRHKLGRLSATARQTWPVCGENCPSRPERQCHRNCPYIPWALSDAPEEHPLEGRIAPLVYELNRLSGIRTCWSCEGHERFNGPWKMPQVWFYAETQIHIRVLADAVNELALKGALRVDWEVVVTFSDPDNPDTTYALRPKQIEDSVPLCVLRADVVTLASSLVDLYQDRAQILQAAVS